MYLGWFGAINLVPRTIKAFNDGLALSLGTIGKLFFSTGHKGKTNKSTAARFHLMSDGTYAYRRSGRNHNFAKKSNPYRTRHRSWEQTDGAKTRMVRSLLK